MSYLLIIERPNTIGVTSSCEYESFADAEEFARKKIKGLKSRGWDCQEVYRTETRAIVECTHDNVADSIIITCELVA